MNRSTLQKKIDKHKKKLRLINNYLKTFDNQSQCEQYISSVSSQDRIIFIVSGRLDRQIVLQIHYYRQISSIYVYCMDQQFNEQWAIQYTKVFNIEIFLVIKRWKFL